MAITGATIHRPSKKARRDSTGDRMRWLTASRNARTAPENDDQKRMAVVSSLAAMKDSRRRPKRPRSAAQSGVVASRWAAPTTTEVMNVPRITARTGTTPLTQRAGAPGFMVVSRRRRASPPGSLWRVSRRRSRPSFSARRSALSIGPKSRPVNATRNTSASAKMQ